ncbi:MAG: HTH domain-containing protein [Planctomycetota bacterium]|nr:HTH domain-containing protein [Planctomycetota bacterium]MDI6787431.1 HTH domain-containing protein [Planctomycetota bacterium]
MQDEIFIDTVIKSSSEFADSIGINSVVAQIYALLYVSPSVLSLDEISEKLHLSKSTVSQNIRILEGWDAVKNTFVKGSRKDYYEVNHDIMGIILTRLKRGLSNRLSKAEKNLNEMVNLITTVKDTARKKFYQKRLEKLREIYQKILTLAIMIPDKM